MPWTARTGRVGSWTPTSLSSTKTTSTSAIGATTEPKIHDEPEGVYKLVSNRSEYCLLLGRACRFSELAGGPQGLRAQRAEIGRELHAACEILGEIHPQ